MSLDEGLSPVKLNAVLIRGFNDDEAVELKKMRGFGDILRPWVFVTCSVVGQLPVTGGIEAKSSQRIKIHKLKRAINGHV